MDRIVPGKTGGALPGLRVILSHPWLLSGQVNRSVSCKSFSFCSQLIFFWRISQWWRSAWGNQVGGEKITQNKKNMLQILK